MQFPCIGIVFLSHLYLFPLFSILTICATSILSSHLVFAPAVEEEKWRGSHGLLSGSCPCAPSSVDWLSWTAAFFEALCLWPSQLSAHLTSQHLLNQTRSLHAPHAALLPHLYPQAGPQHLLAHSHHLFFYFSSSCLHRLTDWKAAAAAARLSSADWAHLVSCGLVSAAWSRDQQNPGPSHPWRCVWSRFKKNMHAYPQL